MKSRTWSSNFLGFDNQLIIDDGFNYRVGAEYLGLTYPIRFGAFRDVILAADEGDDTPKNLVGITVGIGANGGESFSWNASALFGTWDQDDDEGRKYSENLIRVGISVTYLFDTNIGQ